MILYTRIVSVMNMDGGYPQAIVTVHMVSNHWGSLGKPTPSRAMVSSLKATIGARLASRMLNRHSTPANHTGEESETQLGRRVAVSARTCVSSSALAATLPP